MRPFRFALAPLLAFGLAGSMPAFANSPTASSPVATPVAMGCGAGYARDAAGHCRRRFDQFRQYSQFRAFKKRDCTKVHTPDGRIDWCKI